MSQFVDDGSSRYVAGQDAYNSPDHIREDAYAKGVNVSTRRGVLGPRAPYTRLELTFDDQTITTRFHYTRTIKEVFESGKYQAAIPYFHAGERYILFVIAGLVFRLNPRLMFVTLLSDTVKVNQLSARINWSLAGQYVVLFDFPDFPLIVDGDTVHRASPTHTINGVLQPEVPISTLGAYNNNRLFIGNAGSAFTAGDPTGSLATPEAPVTFTEVLTPFAPFLGQSFTLGTENTQQPITAMGFLQTLDQNTGQGPLFVATANAIYTFQTNLPRAQWTEVQFGTLLLFNAGIVGPRAVANVNSDLVFLSAQGKVHALSTARNDTRRWGNVPISREVENWLIYNDPALRSLAFVEYFDNRIFIAANPYRVDALTIDNEPVTDYAHGGMVALILDNVATLQQDQVPVWEGLWTGLRPMDMVNSGDRCFVISKDSTRINRVYELEREGTVDIIGGKERRISSLIYTKEYDFRNPFVDKNEQTVTLGVEDVTGQLDIQVDRRPSHFDNFTPWGSFSHCAPYQSCEMPATFNGYAPHNFKELIIGSPDDKACDPVSRDLLEAFRKIQLRLSIKARSWELHEMKIRAVEQPKDDRMTACEYARPLIPADCDPDWLLISDDGCEDGDCNN